MTAPERIWAWEGDEEAPRGWSRVGAVGGTEYVLASSLATVTAERDALRARVAELEDAISEAHGSRETWRKIDDLAERVLGLYPDGRTAAEDRIAVLERERDEARELAAKRLALLDDHGCAEMLP